MKLLARRKLHYLYNPVHIGESSDSLPCVALHFHVTELGQSQRQHAQLVVRERTASNFVRHLTCSFLHTRLSSNCLYSRDELRR